MNPDAVDRIRASFALAVTAGSDAGMLFYNDLFARAPTIRPLFPADMTEQATKLIAMLGSIVDALPNVETIRPELQRLGVAHVGYGAQPVHYAVVEESLLAMLRELGGGRLDVQTEAAWRSAYAAVAGAMICAAA